MSVPIVRQAVVVFLTIAMLVSPTAVYAQAAAVQDIKLIEAQWLEFKRARYQGRPILLHLKSGQERAVLMPERIRLLDDTQSLPGCAVEIDTDAIGFFPTQDFDRKSIKFLGLESGIIYELRVRASPDGIKEPLQILR